MTSNSKPSLLNRLIHRNSKEKLPMEPTESETNSELPPLSPVTLNGYKATTKHKLLEPELADNLRNLLPPRLQLFGEWDLIYSIEQHGISMNTLYQNCDPKYQLQQLRKQQRLEKGYGDSIIHSMTVTSDGSIDRNRRPLGYIMIIKDSKNNKFGCYLNEPLKAMDHKRYYGNGECFLWKLEKVDKNSSDLRFKAFMYTGINDNIIYSNHDFISVGSSSGKNGLWINQSLDEGVSYSCDTFGNEILNGNSQDKLGKFKIIGLEIWRVGTLE